MGCCMHKCTSWCGILLVDVSDFIAFLSVHVQWGNTPLLRSAQEGHAEIARFLLWNGSDVQEENNVSRLERMPSACGFYLMSSAIFWSMYSCAFLVSFEVWSSRLFKLNVHFSLSLCACALSVHVCVHLCVYVWFVYVFVFVSVCVLAYVCR